MTIPTLPIDVESHGLIGDRALRALQLLRIGRHPSSAMLVPQNGIWVVSGRGPENGSNGAGKTVLLGAMSLLSGDPQWRGENGIGPNAARLLFDHNRARVSDVRYADATHGYIAGVYLHAETLDDAITVWMRIERHASAYVQVRWGHGIRLVDGDSEDNRFTQANDLWATLRDGQTLKVTEYAEALYGKAPRCIAYIRARGSEENQDRGLLALGQRPFRPADLATQIITLAGKQSAVENERQFRQELEAAELLLVSKKTAFEAQYRREERELRDIADRKRARDLQIEAAHNWQLYLTLATLLAHHSVKEISEAVNQLEVTARNKQDEIAIKETELARLRPHSELARLLAEATDAVKTATGHKNDLIVESGGNKQRRADVKDKIAKLQATANLAPGLSVPTAEARLTEASQRRQLAEQAVGREEGRRDAAKEYLDRLRAGRGGPASGALDALDAEGIPAASILDLVTLDEAVRPHWEARLSPYAKVVVVAKRHIEQARRILANHHQGTPLLVSNENPTTLDRTEPGGTGLLAELLRRLEERMPAASPSWVIDSALNLEIPGGFDVPLTNRQATIQAAEHQLAEAGTRLNAALEEQTTAGDAFAAAETGLTAAKAAIELGAVQPEFTKLLRRANELVGLIAAAEQEEGHARDTARAADTNYQQATQQRSRVVKELDELKNGDNGLVQLRLRLAETRQKITLQKDILADWKQVANITDPDVAETLLAEQTITLDHATRDAYHQQARSTLRQAVEAVLAPSNEIVDTIVVPTHAGLLRGEELRRNLNDDLRELHGWCDNPRAIADRARTFDAVAKPLRSWLEWNGADDATREDQIHINRAKNERDITAAEAQTEETRRWIESQRDNQVAIITKAFQDTEKTLNALLAAVNQDPIALRPQHTDLKDPDQPLRWELHPRWVPEGRRPVDYSNPPNTAELIILHVLLATASLVAASVSRGRTLILDESGNNLDGPNLTKVSAVLKQVAMTYGLTVVLACQDVYTDRVARHGAGMIQLLRPSLHDPLNAPPTVVHGPEDPAVLAALMPYLNIERPNRTSDPDVEPE